MTLNSNSVLPIAVILIIIAAGTAFLLMSNDKGDENGGTEKTYTIRYDMNGGTGSIEDDNEYPASTPVTIQFEPAPKRTG